VWKIKKGYIMLFYFIVFTVIGFVIGKINEGESTAFGVITK
jgi:hypothetical protein